jgi:hypothetical protein
VEPDRHVRKEHDRVARAGQANRDDDDRRDRSDHAPDGLKRGGEDGGRGRLIGRTWGAGREVQRAGQREGPPYYDVPFGSTENRPYRCGSASAFDPAGWC